MDERDNFFVLISKKNILIPTIQRDYVHGRFGNNVEFIRKDIISDFIKVLNREKQIDFNYIYGIEKEGDFYLPIDGQQRLTSAFLLVWFCAVKEKKTDVFSERTKKFSYQVRTTAEQFFELLQLREGELLRYRDDFYKYTNDKYCKLQDFSWFNRKWFSDQTVRSAIVFLDELKESIFEKSMPENCTEYLLSRECPIEFVLISQNSNQEQDNKSEKEKENDAFEAENRAAITYINMNARGKVLNGFENLKALIHMSGADGREFVKEYDNNYINVFAELVNKMNNKEQSLSSRVSKMDEMTLNFLINVYVELDFLYGSEKKVISNEYEFMDELKLRRATRDVFPPDYFEFIRKVFELYETSGEDAVFREYFRNNCNARVNKKQKWEFYLYAWVRFRFEEYRFFNQEEWDILERNLEMGKEERWHEGLKVLEAIIDKIIVSQKTIPEFLSEIENVAGFIEEVKGKRLINQVTLSEEVIKAKIYLEDTDRRDLLEAVGKRRNYKLRYLLYFAGYYSGNGNWDDFCKYEKYDKLIGAESDENYLWEKAFYIENCGMENGRWVPATDLLHFNRNDLFYWEDENKRPTEALDKLKRVYDKLFQTSKDIEIYIQEVKKSVTPVNWVYYILHCNDLEMLTWIVKERNGSYYVGEQNYFEKVLLKDLSAKGITNRSNVFVKDYIDGRTVAPRENDGYVNSRNITIYVYAYMNLKGLVIANNKEASCYKIEYDSHMKELPFEDVFKIKSDNCFIEARNEEYRTILQNIEDVVRKEITEDDLYNSIFKGAITDTKSKFQSMIGNVVKEDAGWEYSKTEIRYNQITIWLEYTKQPFSPASGSVNKKHSDIVDVF